MNSRNSYYNDPELYRPIMDAIVNETFKELQYLGMQSSEARRLMNGTMLKGAPDIVEIASGDIVAMADKYRGDMPVRVIQRYVSDYVIPELGNVLEAVKADNDRRKRYDNDSYYVRNERGNSLDNYSDRSRSRSISNSSNGNYYSREDDCRDASLAGYNPLEKLANKQRATATQTQRPQVVEHRSSNKSQIQDAVQRSNRRDTNNEVNIPASYGTGARAQRRTTYAPSVENRPPDVNVIRTTNPIDESTEVSYTDVDMSGVLKSNDRLFEFLGARDYLVRLDTYKVFSVVTKKSFNTLDEATMLIQNRFKNYVEGYKFFIEATVPLLHTFELNEVHIHNTKLIILNLCSMVGDLASCTMDKFIPAVEAIITEINKMPEKATAYFSKLILTRLLRTLHNHAYEMDTFTSGIISLSELKDLIDLFEHEPVLNNIGGEHSTIILAKLIASTLSEIFHDTCLVGENDLPTLAYANGVVAEYNGYVPRDIPFIEDKATVDSLVARINTKYIIHTTLERVALSNKFVVTPTNGDDVYIGGTDDTVVYLIAQFSINNLFDEPSEKQPYRTNITNFVYSVNNNIQVLDKPVVIGTSGNSILIRKNNLVDYLPMGRLGVTLDGVGRDLKVS